MPHTLKPLWLVALIAPACAAESEPREPARPAAAAAPRAVRDDQDRIERPRVAAASSTRTATDASADPKALSEAQDLLQQGLAAYHVGAYDEAETLLKRSITLYPFLAPANLALGKIFLLKGAANRDEALIQSARLMFDMAHTIDPSLREPMVLLELFKPRGN